MTKLFALGALGAGVVAAVRAAKQRSLERAEQKSIQDEFDLADLDEPVVVTEEVVIISEIEPIEGTEQRRESSAAPSEMPRRDAGPR